jgi:CBS domain-containing protein
LLQGAPRREGGGCAAAETGVLWEVIMRTIRDVMSGDIEVLRTTDTAADAACFLTNHGVDSAPLCHSDGSLAGTVSARDIVAQVVAKGRDPREVSLAEFTGTDGDLVALDVDVSLQDAVAVMCRHQRRRLPVLQEARVVGFVTQRDVARSISFQPPWTDS